MDSNSRKTSNVPLFKVKESSKSRTHLLVEQDSSHADTGLISASVRYTSDMIFTYHRDETLQQESDHFSYIIQLIADVLPVDTEQGMNAETCVSYSDMTSMDSYYSPTAAQGRDHHHHHHHHITDHFRTSFPTADTKYSPITAFLPNKGQAYGGEKSRSSPFQQEGLQSLDAAAATGQSTFSKYHLFMQRSSSCKTPEEEDDVHQERGHNGALVSCYGVALKVERDIFSFQFYGLKSWRTARQVKTAINVGSEAII
ncbi:homeobox protein aristaless-like 4 [Solea senegalensis]|uniref:Homeobox protein aristaless-like 4 n=1 Tax=Solea senegalensis TaxID=28829 RepID=A0AAV6P9W0_SOLSE|nr:homeobox protein aristaless-like 4 [Solea senegalensis]